MPFVRKSIDCSLPTHAQATLLLEVGDQIAVQLYDTSDYYYNQNVKMKQTMTFTGFLLSSLNKVDMQPAIL